MDVYKRLTRDFGAPSWIQLRRAERFSLPGRQGTNHRFAGTVLAGSPNRSATCRAAALSQACPTASSKRLLNGALLGNCGTFSILIPQSGQQTRYTSTTTVVRNSMQGKSRTARSLTS